MTRKGLSECHSSLSLIPLQMPQDVLFLHTLHRCRRMDAGLGWSKKYASTASFTLARSASHVSPCVYTLRENVVRKTLAHEPSVGFLGDAENNFYGRILAERRTGNKPAFRWRCGGRSCEACSGRDHSPPSVPAPSSQKLRCQDLVRLAKSCKVFVLAKSAKAALVHRPFSLWHTRPGAVL